MLCIHVTENKSCTSLCVTAGSYCHHTETPVDGQRALEKYLSHGNLLDSREGTGWAISSKRGEEEWKNESCVFI